MPSARRDSCARPQELHERERRGRNEGDASSYFTIVRRGVRFLLFPTLALCSQRSQDSHARSRTATQTKRRRCQGHTRLGAVSRLVTG